jgi:hypothetical protein
MDIRKLKELGELAALDGCPRERLTESFYAIPDIEHSEEARAEYEKAYRGTDVELRHEGP